LTFITRGLLVGRRTENNIVASTVTDCEGNFKLPVSPGSYRISGGHPDHPQPRSATAVVTSGAMAFDILLQQNATPQPR